MIIDVIVTALIVIAVFKGFRNGLVLAIFSLLAFIVGLAAAVKLSALVADYLSTETNIRGRWLPALAFLLVFLGVALLVRLGAKAIEGGMRMVMLGWLNKLAGAFFYVALYLLVFSVLLFYAQQLGVIKPSTAALSFTYPLIYPLAPEVIGSLGVVIPFFKNMFAELEAFFDGFARKA